MSERRSASAGRSSGAGVAMIGDIQRARILAAMGEVLAERGLANATVERVVSRAGVSRRTFYELFAGLEACFLASFDDALALATATASAAYDPEAQWIDAIRATVYALLGLFDERPTLVHVLFVESFGAGPRMFKRRERIVGGLAAAVDRGREQVRAREAAGLSPLTAEGVVGGALALAQGRICAEGDAPLIELAGTIVSMIALPYLGAAAARRELERPAPAVRAPPVAADPLRELPMRLTYRTVRVLQAVAARPGASNRAIGAAAGIEDQGQISKLLRRLEQIGLLANASPERRGAPNNWTLTDTGDAVLGLVADPMRLP
ncbi:MAG TPA: helix-turn-helix domain-containing protein [Solirubrobacteraceae bacterium]|jgi:AcrR family transcriptional regulator|nr:helix-turn-helix domain-containing protein [Solirubrobacteraceae bacterium]